MSLLALFRRGVVRAGGLVRLAPRPSPNVHAALQLAGLLELFGADEEKPAPVPGKAQE
jgi:hypothetical protein